MAIPKLGTYQYASADDKKQGEIHIHSFTDDKEYVFVSYPDAAYKFPIWVSVEWFKRIKLTPVKVKPEVKPTTTKK